MATIKDLAKEYANYLELNKDNPNVINELISKINSLTYTKNKKPISISDKQKLIEEIENIISNTERIINEGEDSSELIKLIKIIKDNITK